MTASFLKQDPKTNYVVRSCWTYTFYACLLAMVHHLQSKHLVMGCMEKPTGFTLGLKKAACLKGSSVNKKATTKKQ